MNHHDGEQLPKELGEIAGLLRSHRPEAEPLELDRIKLRVMASRRRGALLSRKGNVFMRSRAFSLLVLVGVLGGGSGALAAAGVGPFDAIVNDQGASNSQYCPPTSQNPGAHKKPGSINCGHPKTKVPPGQANKLGLGGLPPGQAKKLGASSNSSGGEKGNGHRNGSGPGNGKGGKKK
jgi:hypothetical protein